MYNRGSHKGRDYFSHGNYLEGFKFFKKSGKESGWFSLSSLVPFFTEALKTGNFQDFSMTDDEGKTHDFSKTELKMFLEEFLSTVFENLSEGKTKEKIEFAKKCDFNFLFGYIKE